MKWPLISAAGLHVKLGVGERDNEVAKMHLLDKLASVMRRCMGRALSDRAGLRRAEKKKLEDEKN